MTMTLAQPPEVRRQSDREPTPSGRSVISVHGLRRRFGSAVALDGLDLEVAPGEVHGFLGPNGAGKSTTLRILLGLLRSDGGHASVFGLEPWHDAQDIHRRLAYVSGDVAIWPHLTGGQTIDLLIRMRGADPTRSRRQSLVERFSLDPTRKGRAYSRGNRQKVERLAERVTIIRDGRTVESGTLREMRHLLRSTVRAEVDGEVPGLHLLPDVHDVAVNGHNVACTVGESGLRPLLEELTAAACQLSASARSCAAFAAAGVGVLFLVRAVGDTTMPGLSWMSPFGWSTQLRAYSHTRWWVLLLYVAAGLLLFGLAQGLRSRRDLGLGLFPSPPPGRAAGSRRLSNAIALCLRLHAAPLVTWTVSVAAMSLVLGAMAPQLAHLLDSPSTRHMIQRLGGFGRVQETLVAAELSVVAVVVTCFAISVVGHAGSDEQAGRTELVLATATSRSTSFLGTALVSLVGSAWLLLVTGVALTVGYRAAGGGLVQDIVAAAVAQVPAVWVVAGLATACFAARSDGTAVAWALLVLLLVALGLVVASWQRYRLRDIRS